MARTNLPQTLEVWNSGVLFATGTTVDQANGMNVAFASTGIPAAPGMGDVLLYVTNTSGADKNIIIRAGVGGGVTAGPAFRSGIGDLTFLVTTAAGGAIVGPFEAARFAQTDGSLNIDFQSGFTGVIKAFVRPSRFV